MKQVLVQNGKIVIADVPAPSSTPGNILVRVAYSLISTGTEVGIVEAAAKSLIHIALEQPEKVRKLVDMLQQQGVDKTLSKIREKTSMLQQLGYSCVGVVLDSGQQNGDAGESYSSGEWVACAGAGLANHAEIVSVPRHLVVKVPEGCDPKAAASVTLGAIALQGVRRAEPRLGDHVAVIGLGLLGQLTVQLLRAAGCQVIGFDIDPERVRLAQSLGAPDCYHAGQNNPVELAHRLTANHGVDAVIITAASSSDAIVQQAMEMTRKKGKVVVVGAVGLGLKRSPFYEKEIDFLISTSYGPGRYDPVYEEQGHDYPYAYVRWTENRNMQEYLRLIATNKVQVLPILEQEYPVEKAAAAFTSLLGEGRKPLGILLRYPTAETGEPQRIQSVTINGRVKSPGRIGVALIGAGSFAKAVHLPNLEKLDKHYDLRMVVSSTGVNAKAAAERFGATTASTRQEDAFSDSSVDLLLISTRHDLHASMVLRGLQAGKHVLVEKPLALTESELVAIEEFYASSGDSLPVLMTGFNRRFSPYAQKIHSYLSKRKEPCILNYRMNAGYIPLDHWVHSAEGGGRNLGEACHIYDLFTYLIGSKAVSVQASSLRPAGGYYSARDNFIATLAFEDGSLATLTYTALGSNQYPKEKLEVFSEGIVLELDDYKRLTLYDGKPSVLLETRQSEKGHLEELRALAETLVEGGDWPIPFWQQVQATRVALSVDDKIGRHSMERTA
jgi:predicted dehydrogenase/threonine dehydrogenase-like Zn-dependent dehydrogenase